MREMPGIDCEYQQVTSLFYQPKSLEARCQKTMLFEWFVVPFGEQLLWLEARIRIMTTVVSSPFS